MDKFIESTAGISYQAYRELIDALLKENKTTGSNHSEDYLNYTRMNVQRMNRGDKTVLTPELVAAVQAIKSPQIWYVLTEAWCGDAAQTIPAIAKIAAENPLIDFRILLRDEHLDLMDQFLTLGGRSIPKVIFTDKETGRVMGDWGPRPAVLQQEILAMREQGVPTNEWHEYIQLWYGRNRNEELMREWTAMLNSPVFVPASQMV